MAKDVVLTGLRSNDEFHLGNYLGAILPMVQLQKKYAGKYQLNMFIPDLHSFTTPIEHGTLYEQTHQNLKVFVAAGLDIDKPNTFIYRQSYIPAHSELTWILDCFSYFGELSRMTEFKEKGRDLAKEAIRQEIENNPQMSGLKTYLMKEKPDLLASISETEEVSVGLFNYPVLMAADILIYGAKYVPVGDDQRQHVEFARDLAMRLNNKFGELFVVPADNKKQLKFSGRETPVRIRSLRNPDKKMSKSVEDPAGTIVLTDNPDEAAKKVMSATTDSLNIVRYDFDKQSGVANLLQILALIMERPIKDVVSEYEGQTSYAKLKVTVAREVKNFLGELQAKVAQIDDKHLIQKLEADEEAMRKVADVTLLKVQKAVGLRPTS